MSRKTIIAIGLGVLVATGAAWYFFAVPRKIEVSDIRVSAPTPGSAVGSPLEIAGEARGNWYFEAVFPVTLVDSDGKIIAQGIAQAEGEWMTVDFVPFKVTLVFISPPAGTAGVLVLHNDNPSGLPEHDREIRIPVRFGGRAATSGVIGVIHVGPTCPVERIPPDPNCADRPYADAKVVVKNKASGSMVSQSISDAAGSFRIALLPGAYLIEVSPPNGNSLPRCETKEATVKVGSFTSVEVNCDSGIR